MRPIGSLREQSRCGMTTEPELRTPREWEAVFGFRIVDPDGWDRTNLTEDWANPITREEFKEKAMGSTIEMSHG